MGLDSSSHLKESIEGICAQNLLKGTDTGYAYPEIIDPIPDEALRYSSVYIHGSTNLNIYPVPTDAILYVEIGGEVEVNSVLELVNLNGLTISREVVQTDAFSAICWFNVGEFASGIYLLNLYDASGKKLASGKAIIQH